MDAKSAAIRDAELHDELHGFYIEDLTEGMSSAYAKTIVDADIVMFAGISGDTNPLHLNEEFSCGGVFEGRIAHGMLTASFISAAIGTKLPGPGCVYLSQSMKFLYPVKAGDTVVARVSVQSIDRRKSRVIMETVCSVAGKQVLVGEALIMVPSRDTRKSV